MSSIIKSFNVVEDFNKEKIENSDDINYKKYKDIMMYETNENCELIIEKAKEKSKQIVQKADKKAQFKLEEANNEANEIYNDAKTKGQKEGFKEGEKQGYDKGYKEGYQKGKKESDKLIEQSIEIKNEYLNKKDEIYNDIEQDVIKLVFKICEKIINQKLDKDKDIIVSLVLKGLDDLNVKDDLIIRISKKDYKIVNMSKNKILAKASLVENLKIKIDSKLEKGDCILETSKGSVDVSIKYQLKEVKELLNNLLNSE